MFVVVEVVDFVDDVDIDAFVVDVDAFVVVDVKAFVDVVNVVTKLELACWIGNVLMNDMKAKNEMTKFLVSSFILSFFCSFLFL